MAATLAGLGIALTLVFVPTTYILNDQFYLPLSFRGFPVVRYGFSRVGELSFSDYIDGTGGNVHSARSFIDYVKDGKVRRVYGWRLEVRANPERTLVRLSLR